MRLEQEFTVEVPLDRAWLALSNLGTFAACLPDADLHPADEAFAGRVTLGMNGNRVVCETTLRSVDQDDDDHVATIQLHGRQVDGPGIGSVNVRSRCESADSSTRVQLSAEVVASGHEQPGEAFERASRELFDQVGERLRDRATSGPPPLPSESAPAPPPDSGAAPDTAAGWGAEAARALPRSSTESRLALAVAATAAIALIRWLLGRRRRGPW